MKIELFKKNIQILDFNEKSWELIFIAAKQRFWDIAVRDLHKIEQKNPQKHYRENLDGILIEKMIQIGTLPDADIIIKDTYTAFYKGTISNFPNGRELVIRHPRKVIKGISVCYHKP